LSHLPILVSRKSILIKCCSVQLETGSLARSPNEIQLSEDNLENPEQESFGGPEESDKLVEEECSTEIPMDLNWLREAVASLGLANTSAKHLRTLQALDDVIVTYDKLIQV
jgi:hypothetical protein